MIKKINIKIKKVWIKTLFILNWTLKGSKPIIISNKYRQIGISTFLMHECVKKKKWLIVNDINMKRCILSTYMTNYGGTEKDMHQYDNLIITIRDIKCNKLRGRKILPCIIDNSVDLETYLDLKNLHPDLQIENGFIHSSIL